MIYLDVVKQINAFLNLANEMSWYTSKIISKEKPGVCTIQIACLIPRGIFNVKSLIEYQYLIIMASQWTQ